MVDYGKTIVNNSKVGNKTVEMTKKEYDNFINCMRDLGEIGKLFKPNVPASENTSYYDARSKLERKYKGKFPIDVSLFTLDELKRFKPDVKVVNELSSDVIKRSIESFKKWLNRIDETINFVGKIKDSRDYMKLYSRKYEDIATPMKSMIQPHWEDPDSIKKFKDNMIRDLKLFKHSKELLLKELEADLKETLKKEK